jgi:4'-phosphopantetheinyl transferase
MAAGLQAEPEGLRALSAWLSPPERARAERYRFLRDRRRFIVARARLRELLGVRLGVPPGAVQLAERPKGKPALAPPHADSGVSFNVAHSEELAVYALAAAREVGIDVEAIRPVPEADAIAARFFSPPESEAYRRLAAHDRPLAFLSWWTRKEAFAKALGEGLDLLLDRFDLAALSSPPGWRLESFSPLPGFIAAVASHQP